MNTIQWIPFDSFDQLISFRVGSNSLNGLIIIPIFSIRTLHTIIIDSSSLMKVTVFPLQYWTVLHTLIIGSNSLISVKQLELIGLNELTIVSIDSSSLSGMESLIIGNVNVIILQFFGFTPYESGYSFNLNATSILHNVKYIEVKENTTILIYRFVIIGLTRLETIVIGPNSIIGDVSIESYFIIEDCSHLYSVIIGENSFTHYKSLVLTNCSNLREFDVGMWSFWYVRIIELRVIGLETITIGNQQFPYLESFIVDGLNRLTQLDVGEGNGVMSIENGRFVVINCVVLVIVIVRDGSFRYYGVLTIEKNPRLTEMKLGHWCFSRAYDVRLIGKKS